MIKSNFNFCFANVFAFLTALEVQCQPINLSPDTHVPFVYGVASGDPSSSSVIIWTATEPNPQFHGAVATWKLAKDSLLANVVQSGNATLDSNSGYTIKQEVSLLQADTRYFYSFSINGSNSTTGITRTAPSAGSNGLSFALVSCSSLFSGYFNGYRQIASMKNLNGLIHVGDYIYDFVDAEERVRIPQPEPPDPDDNSVEDWRNRHRLYLQDPDLREAKRVMPWIHTWDNHDVLRNNPGASSKAFREFVPFKEDAQDTLKIWRSIRYGNLLDIMMIDINVEARKDSFLSGNKAVMTNVQFNWLKNELKNSTATWKFIGSEKLFSPWNLQGIALPGGGLGGTWNGFTESRDSLLSHIQKNNIKNTVVLSGDLHMNLWSDLAIDPLNPQLYEKATGNGGLGMEIMGTSISRGNVDESGISATLKNFLHNNSLSLNPHQQYINLYDHGFNVISINNDSLVAHSYLCPILTNTNTITLEASRTAFVNENHWKRAAPSAVSEIKLSNKIPLYPNPSNNGFFTVDLSSMQSPSEVLVVDASGKVVLPRTTFFIGKHQLNSMPLAVGIYFVGVESAGQRFIERIVVQR
jgi:alkaline phosphatase D